MHTDTDTVDIDDIDAALDASADDKEQDAAPTFAELGVPKPLVHVLAMDGKVTAFPIQADTLADSLNGVDLLGRGQTGSGKTLAFAIPLVARLSEHSVTEVAMKEFEQIRKASDEKAAREQASLPRPRGLVLAPTRELVNQIDEVIQPLAEAYGMSTVTVYGGVSYARQVAGLRAGADIVVACPGRLEDLLRQGKLSLDAVEITILDEADEMADMGFLPPVTRLLEQTDSRGQRMLFSATLDHHRHHGEHRDQHRQTAAHIRQLTGGYYSAARRVRPPTRADTTAGMRHDAAQDTSHPAPRRAHMLCHRAPPRLLTSTPPL